jgi:hypothetical protein
MQSTEREDLFYILILTGDCNQIFPAITSGTTKAGTLFHVKHIHPPKSKKKPVNPTKGSTGKI